MKIDETRVIQPGSTIGMVGGGQLGRMFAVAASAMGFRVIILCEDPEAPAAQVVPARHWERPTPLKYL